MFTRSNTGVRVWQLAILYDEELRKLGAIRVAGWLSVVIGAIAVLFMVARQATSVGVVGVAVDALGWLSWLVAGWVTLSALSHWQDFQQSLWELAAQRGVSVAMRMRAAPLALAIRLTRLLGGPAILLACVAVALSPGTTHLPGRLSLLVTMPLYVLLLAVGLAALARALVELTHSKRSLWLLAIVVGPHVLRELWPGTVSFIAVYERLLQQVAAWGQAA